MDSSILSGSDAPPPRWLGVAWAGGAGYVMSLVALAHILGDSNFGLHELPGLLLLGVVPGLLCAAAALLGVQSERVSLAILLTLLGSLGVSLVCAPLTWVVFTLLVDSPAMWGSRSGFENLGAVTVIGGFIGAPLGVVFGLVFSAGISLLVALRSRASRASLDASLVIVGLGWVAVGATVAAVLATHEVGALFGSAPRALDRDLVWISSALAATGLGVALTGAARWALMRWLASQIRAGARPGWAVVAAEQIEGAEDLPRLFPLGRIDGVLVRRALTSEGPFRSGEPSSAIARVAL